MSPTPLIPLMRVLYSTEVYDESEYIKCPLYRDERTADIMANSMAKHRSYARTMLARHTDYDEIQEWLIGLVALLYRRLDQATSTLSENQLIRQQAMPECLDDKLRLYRETLLKLLT